MAKLPKPTKPLKILTIDGGGLQGISTLFVLDRLLGAIARNNGVPDSKPRPCDVFDVIAGIGPGGWLALLLGRFQMDVSSALAEWYNLIDCIAPRSRTEQIRMRLMQHSYFDMHRLVDQIDQLTEFYETDKHMFLEPSHGTRCKHVFVSALRTASKDSDLGYSLFRTYDVPQGCKLLDGPADPPHKYPISHAFAATGAAKYFTPPWREKKGKARYLDTQFPSPHNITELALDEMWGLYGTDVEISVIVNIGPGTLSASDCRSIARRFSWGMKVVASKPAFSKRRRSSGNNSVPTDFKKARSYDYEPVDETPDEPTQTSHQACSSEGPQTSAGDTERGLSIPHHSTFGSERNVEIEDKLRRDEREIEDNIRRKLHNIYPENTPPYYRLGPEKSAPGTAQNDTSSPKASFDATTAYLHDGRVKANIEEVGQRVHLDTSAIAC